TFENALHGKCIITPHLGEFTRLWPKISWDDKVRAAGEAARKTGAVALLKGPDTVISDGKTTVINTHASADLATAGAGDVLCGIIAAFLAQGAAPLSAAAIGAWVHGDAAIRLGRGLISEDLVEAISKTLKGLAK
ncbi:MAG TPA: ADP/ATP-dependent (S)-NAD(P)H-hydrate dehydratase, partial [Sphingomonadales bacterium]|nr:ADP/ATP-dependent (S)-NAD(P)H-hydrate dehydratase [Sphingomonadales bacterium]